MCLHEVMYQGMHNKSVQCITTVSDPRDGGDAEGMSVFVACETVNIVSRQRSFAADRSVRPSLMSWTRGDTK